MTSSRSAPTARKAARARTGMSRIKKRAAGFTLLEVIVVLVIAAIAYALILGVPFRGTSTYDLKASARALATGLRQVQSTAMATRRDASLTLDLDAREFVLSG